MTTTHHKREEFMPVITVKGARVAASIIGLVCGMVGALIMYVVMQVQGCGL